MLLYFLLCLILESSLLGYNKIQIANVVQAAKKNQPFNASGCDFRGSATLLQNSNFQNWQLTRANFSTNGNIVTAKTGTIAIPNQITDVSGSNFSKTTARSVNFTKCVLKKTIWNNADVAYSDFSQADLTGSNIEKAKNTHLAKFCNTIMPDGTKCSAKTWKSKTGKVIHFHCSTNSK